ncbi:MAG: RNA polymerase sigma-70 factor [Odoribacter sp.]
MIQNEEVYRRDVMGAIVQGDKAAFEQLFREWYVRLCVYAESIVRDRDMAEDLVQNIFCMLWEKRVEMNIHESLKSYLYRAVYNSALNLLKHEKVKLAFLEFVGKHGEKGENNVEYYFDKESEKGLLQEINQAIDALPEQCREIFMLSRFAGKKSTEIALMLDISVRTVETQLYRAMKHLREDLAHLKNREILFLLFML